MQRSLFYYFNLYYSFVVSLFAFVFVVIYFKAKTLNNNSLMLLLMNYKPRIQLNIESYEDIIVKVRVISFHICY